MSDHSEAIEKGVYNWLEANRNTVLEMIHRGIRDSTLHAVESMASGIMVSVGKFLDANNDDLKAGIATAIATSWAARQRPVPKETPEKTG